MSTGRSPTRGTSAATSAACSQVHRPADEPVTGRLLSAGAEGVTLLTQGLKGRPGHEAHIPYADIDRAQVQVEFARGTNEEDS